MHPIPLSQLTQHGFTQREIEQLARQFSYLNTEPAAVSLRAYFPDAGEQYELHKCGRIDDLCGNLIVDVLY